MLSYSISADNSSVLLRHYLALLSVPQLPARKTHNSRVTLYSYRTPLQSISFLRIFPTQTCLRKVRGLAHFHQFLLLWDALTRLCLSHVLSRALLSTSGGGLSISLSLHQLTPTLSLSLSLSLCLSLFIALHLFLSLARSLALSFSTPHHPPPFMHARTY